MFEISWAAEPPTPAPEKRGSDVLLSPSCRERRGGKLGALGPRPPKKGSGLNTSDLPQGSGERV
eukprot:7705991-Alexandrium_andersonii.AAC.1